MTQPQTSQNLVPVQPQNQSQEVYIPTQQDWKFMLEWGQSAIKSGMLPTAIRTPEAAAIIILKGRELGISYMQAISHIHVINGKPSMSAELIQGLARKNLPGIVMNILESTNLTARMEFIRPERGSKPYIQTFSMDDAKAANLINKDVWKQYPQAMLFSRCITSGLRKVCPEALMGISYTPEELGANVDGEGNVIATTGRRIPDDEIKPEGPKANPIPPVAIPPVQEWTFSQEQDKEIVELCKRKGMTGGELISLIKSSYGKNSLMLLTENEYINLILNLQELEPPRQPELESESIDPSAGVPWAKYRDVK